jgi:hypothetical protein
VLKLENFLIGNICEIICCGGDGVIRVGGGVCKKTGVIPCGGIPPTYFFLF